MFLSVQLSFYPFTDDHKPPIKAVIERFRESGLEVHSNRMGTQVFGDYDEVMRVFTETMKWSFQKYGQAVFVANFVKGDRRPEA